MRVKRDRWSVISDGGHLWLVMHCADMWIFHDWEVAIHFADDMARWGWSQRILVAVPQ